MNANPKVTCFNATELSTLETLLLARIEFCVDDGKGAFGGDGYIAETIELRALHARIEAAEPHEPSEDGFTYPTGMNAEMVISLICNLWDSGYHGYWSIRGKITKPKGYDQSKAPGDNWTEDYCAKYTAPLMGGSIELFDSETCDMDDEDQPCDWTLDAAAIQRGLDTFPKVAKGYHYRSAIGENDDAITADVFVQCCLFGEIVYG